MKDKSFKDSKNDRLTKLSGSLENQTWKITRELDTKAALGGWTCPRACYSFCDNKEPSVIPHIFKFKSSWTSNWLSLWCPVSVSTPWLPWVIKSEVLALFLSRRWTLPPTKTIQDRISTPKNNRVLCWREDIGYWIAKTTTIISQYVFHRAIKGIESSLFMIHLT